MKKILYAVMLLLGLSIPAISCYGQSQLPSWVIGKWECDKNEVIEFTPSGFIFTVNGKVVDEGSVDVSNGIIYPEGKNGVCQIGFVMMKEKLYFEGGDNVPLKKLSGKSNNNAIGLKKEYEWILGEWKGVEWKGDLAIISRDGIIFNNAVRSALLDEMEPDRSELTKQSYEIKTTKYDFDNKNYVSIVVNGNAEYYLDLKAKVIFYFYDFDQKIILKKVSK